MLSARTWSSLRALAVLVLALLPLIAIACPYCAAKDAADGHRTSYFIGAMITVPFAIAAVAIRAIRRADAQSSDSGKNP